MGRIAKTINADDLRVAYEKIGSIKKLSEIFHTSNSRMIKLLKDNSIVTKNIGNKIELPKNLINSIVKDYVSYNLTMKDLCDKYNLKIDKVSDILSSNNAIKIKRENKTKYSNKLSSDIVSFIKQNGLNCQEHIKLKSKCFIDILVNDLYIDVFKNKDLTEKRNILIDKRTFCNNLNLRYVQIFEDEYVNKKELVLSKISHLLHLTQNKIYARKCIVNEISMQDAESFLNQNHIQGFSKSSVYLGATYNDCLVAVMTFTKENDDKWELKRFATLNGYNVIGVGGKLFSYFIKNYKPNEVKSFADRRWTLDANDNLYVKLGFELNCVLPPDYKYYNQKIDKHKRFHKFNFRKEILHRKYGFPMTMTETEMTRELGFDRIWDCGLFKYVWINKNIK